MNGTLLIALILNLNLYTAASIQGAWQLKGSGDPGEVASLIITADYMSVAVYNESTHEFLRTYGGTYTLTDQKLKWSLEYDSKDTMMIGKIVDFSYQLSSDALTLERESKVTWTRIDDHQSDLAGCWRITARVGNDGTLNAMPQGARKTLKIMSGTRFQWFAINPSTRQFSGTGGGTYTLADGKYTETIEFFSRDKSRVGSSLSFDAKVDGGTWDHSGKSSTGNPVHEIWTRQ